MLIGGTVPNWENWLENWEVKTVGCFTGCLDWERCADWTGQSVLWSPGLPLPMADQTSVLRTGCLNVSAFKLVTFLCSVPGLWIVWECHTYLSLGDLHPLRRMTACCVSLGQVSEFLPLRNFPVTDSRAFILFELLWWDWDVTNALKMVL